MCHRNVCHEEKQNKTAMCLVFLRCFFLRKNVCNKEIESLVSMLEILSPCNNKVFVVNISNYWWCFNYDAGDISGEIKAGLALNFNMSLNKKSILITHIHTYMNNIAPIHTHTHTYIEYSRNHIKGKTRMFKSLDTNKYNGWNKRNVYSMMVIHEK